MFAPSSFILVPTGVTIRQTSILECINTSSIVEVKLCLILYCCYSVIEFLELSLQFHFMFNEDWGRKLVRACSEATLGRFPGTDLAETPHMSCVRSSRDPESETGQDPSRPSRMGWRHSKMAPQTVRDKQVILCSYSFDLFRKLFLSNSTNSALCFISFFLSPNTLYLGTNSSNFWCSENIQTASHCLRVFLRVGAMKRVYIGSQSYSSSTTLSLSTLSILHWERK